MEKLKKVSPYKLASLLRLQQDPKLALQLFLNPNPKPPDPSPKPFQHSPKSYDLILTKLGRAKLFDEMETVLHQLKQETHIAPKEIIFCNVITYYARARLPDKALQTFHRIPSFRCRRTVKSFNTLLNALLICKEFEKLKEVILDIENYACPDACTYNVMINACCLCGDVGNARKMFDEMLIKGITPNGVTFGTLVNGLCANSMLEEACRLKDDMVRVHRVKPDGFIYVALIKGLCRVKEVELALKLKEEMLESKVDIDSAVYSTLISALFKVGRRGEVSSMLEEMKRNGCKPNTITYNAIIFGLCSEKDFDSAFGVLNEMEVGECKPDVISYNVIIGALCREGKLREANDLFEDMPRRRCAPDVVSYRTLLDGLCNGRQFKEAALILDEMLFKGYVPRAVSINNYVAGLLREGDTSLLWTVLDSLASGNCIDIDTWRMVVSMVSDEDKLPKPCEFVDALIME
ncbi:hypothetical protein RJ640_004326 [Escallonia rubra]|uniref:Pentatricopeptide repeat-containing protein n=1 Tax=Escallonia rubra TaxID=112253 RepID=A0AA88RMP0_9ASTE|nr:hypothetical protein RJ640_004326 [Escallonia rubra]